MNKPNLFTKHIDRPIQDKNAEKRHLRLKFLIFLAVLIWSGLAIYGVWSFISTYDFRTPIIIQSPVVKKEIKIDSPTATSSGIIKQVYAEALTPKQYVEKETIKEFGQSHVENMNILIMKESSYNLYAMNKSSGACGLFQFYPCSKLLIICSDLDNLECVVNEGTKYIKERYINPTGALAFWYKNGWY